MSLFRQHGTPPLPPDNATLEQQAHAWVRRLTSGAARAVDAEELARWCARSDAHALAFKRAHRLWRELGPAAELAGAHDPELAALRAQPYPAQQSRLRAAVRSPARRVFLGGALAASAATGMVLLYPAMSGRSVGDAWRADYRTATGEQRELTLATDVRVSMNTRSSIALQSDNGATTGVTLLDGEIAVDTAGRRAPFTVVAGGGRVRLQDGARVELRHLDEGVCVTCISGAAQVALGNHQVSLGAAQQVIYGEHAVQPVRAVNPDEQGAWRRGILSFRETALASVVSEINRYRPGRVMLLSRALEQKPVSGRFRINDLGLAVEQIRQLFHLQETVLPGGIVILT